MDVRLRTWGMLCVSLTTLSACGGTEHEGPEDPGSEAGGSEAGGSSGSSGSSGSNAQAGRAGSVSQGGSTNPVGGSGGAPSLDPSDCSGTFSTPAPGLTEEASATLASPALSPDALTLFYTRISGGQIGFRASTRASRTSVFPAGSPVPELDAACQTDEGRTVDLSSDGLRAYVACYSATAEPLGAATLTVAERVSLTAPFALRSGTIQVGPGAAISKDELRLYTSSDVNAGFKPPRLFVRANTQEPFGAGTAIPGLEDVNLTAPDPAPDGLTLFGGLMSNVVVTTSASADAPFATPTVLFAPADATQQLGAPEISQDCRSLFFVRQTSANGLTTSVLMEARR